LKKGGGGVGQEDAEGEIIPTTERQGGAHKRGSKGWGKKSKRKGFQGTNTEGTRNRDVQLASAAKWSHPRRAKMEKARGARLENGSREWGTTLGGYLRRGKGKKRRKKQKKKVDRQDRLVTRTNFGKRDHS